MVKIAKNYDSSTGYIIQKISSPDWRVKSQNYMLSHPFPHFILIDTDEQ